MGSPTSAAQQLTDFPNESSRIVGNPVPTGANDPPAGDHESVLTLMVDLQLSARRMRPEAVNFDPDALEWEGDVDMEDSALCLHG